MTDAAPRGTDGHLGIVELADVCARGRAASLDLFETLGAWIADTDEPALQRLFVEASHRHAWHAEVWLARTPAIPTVDVEALTGAHRAGREDPPPDRRVWYRTRVDEQLARLESLDARVDPVLDPATRRAIRLVSADLRDLRDRLDN